MEILKLILNIALPLLAVIIAAASAGRPTPGDDAFEQACIDAGWEPYRPDKQNMGEKLYSLPPAGAGTAMPARESQPEKHEIGDMTT
ncbi:MAG: hypothetical protein NC311_13390 [Muribaculaceae bacterium]|nr:hypothetical protein [Muribaculaceae bacterium]